MLQCWKGNEELNKGRDFKLQCSEGSEGAVFSEDVDPTWKCEELLACHEVLNKGRYPMLQQTEGSQVALLSEGVDDTW
jgi:hypothetical protein